MEEFTAARSPREELKSVSTEIWGLQPPENTPGHSFAMDAQEMITNLHRSPDCPKSEFIERAVAAFDSNFASFSSSDGRVYTGQERLTFSQNIAKLKAAINFELATGWIYRAQPPAAGESGQEFAKTLYQQLEALTDSLYAPSSKGMDSALASLKTHVSLLLPEHSAQNDDETLMKTDGDVNLSYTEELRAELSSLVETLEKAVKAGSDFENLLSIPFLTAPDSKSKNNFSIEIERQVLNVRNSPYITADVAADSDVGSSLSTALFEPEAFATHTIFETDNPLLQELKDEYSDLQQRVREEIEADIA